MRCSINGKRKTLKNEGIIDQKSRIDAKTVEFKKKCLVGGGVWAVLGNNNAWDGKKGEDMGRRASKVNMKKTIGGLIR